MTKRVEHYLKLPTGTPEPVTVFNDPCDNLLLAVQALSAMIAHLLIRVVTEEALIEAKRRIKIFLTYYSKFEEIFHTKKEPSTMNITIDATKNNLMENNEIEVARLDYIDDNEHVPEEEIPNTKSKKTKKRKPGCISCSNFMCLLNLPNIMRKFGPLVNLWEGSYQGEGFLRIAKKHVKKGIRGNWQINALNNMMKERSFQNILSKELCESMHLEETNNAEEGDYYSYKNTVEVYQDFLRGKPISLIQLHDKKFGIVYRNKSLFTFNIRRIHWLC